jgi:hypothetical protein
MSHLLHRPIVANASLRSVQLRRRARFSGYFGIGIDDVSQHDRLRRFLKREWVAWAPVRNFTLFTVGSAAIAGTIFALFAWSGVGLQ